MLNNRESERIGFELLVRYGIAYLSELDPHNELNDRYRMTPKARPFIASRLTKAWRRAENVYWALKVAVTSFTADAGASGAEINLMSDMIAAWIYGADDEPLAPTLESHHAAFIEKYGAPTVAEATAIVKIEHAAR